MHGKVNIFLIIIIIAILCIGLIFVFGNKQQNDNSVNQVENTNQFNETLEEVNTNNNNSEVIYSGVITDIKSNIITINYQYQIKIDENTKITNYRTTEDMLISDINIGDYYNSGKIIRNITGEEWRKECIKNLAYCYKEGSLICNPQKITNIQNMGDYVIITLIMEDSTTEYFNGKGNADTFELKAIAYSSLEIPTYSGGVTVYNLKEEVEGFIFWIGLDKDTIDNQNPTINDIEIYDK